MSDEVKAFLPPFSCIAPTEPVWDEAASRSTSTVEAASAAAAAFRRPSAASTPFHREN